MTSAYIIQQEAKVIEAKKLIKELREATRYQIDSENFNKDQYDLLGTLKVNVHVLELTCNALVNELSVLMQYIETRPN